MDSCPLSEFRKGRVQEEAAEGGSGWAVDLFSWRFVEMWI